MIITRITRQRRKKDLYSVCIDGEYAFSVTDENRVKQKLFEGREVDNEEINGILSEDEKRRAMDYALTFLGVRSRSKKELSERLKRQEFSANAVNHTIERLVELGYINDTSFAREWFKNLKDKGNGPERVRAELRRKGISSDIIAALMSEYRESPEAELERLTAITERKMRSMKGVDPATAARRLTGYLARKGFSIDSIRRVLRALTRDAGEDNNFQD